MFVVTTATPLQQGQQLVVVLHEPKEAAAIARAIKQEARPAATAPAEFISMTSSFLASSVINISPKTRSRCLSLEDCWITTVSDEN